MYVSMKKIDFVEDKVTENWFLLWMEIDWERENKFDLSVREVSMMVKSWWQEKIDLNLVMT